ncbi:MAG: hypothetical protein ACJAUV_002407 [Flavobacteriales bacterium]|jgi:uncharacterized protein (DUF983 family)
MLTKGKKTYSIFKGKCPQCHEGKMFDYHPYNFSKIGDMRSHCTVCKLKYSREPGFFFGAAYVSYMITVSLGIFGFVTTRLLLGESPWQLYLSVVIGLILLLFPLTFVLSRTIWINMFVKYNPDCKKDQEAS